VLVWLAVVLDVVCVLAFAFLGRRSHAEELDLLGVLGTAWPFLAGLAGGWLLVRGWRRPEALTTGVSVWLAAVGIGVSLRLLSGRTAEWPFVVVATVVLGLLLVGWRAGRRLASAARSRPDVVTGRRP